MSEPSKSDLSAAVHLLKNRLPSGNPTDIAYDFVDAYIYLGEQFLQEVKQQKILFAIVSIDRANAVCGSIHNRAVEEASHGHILEDDARKIARLINEHRVILTPKLHIIERLEGLACWHIQRDSALLQVATEIELQLLTLNQRAERQLEQPHRKSLSLPTQGRLVHNQVKNLLESWKAVIREVLRRNPESGRADSPCPWNQALILAQKWVTIQIIEDRYTYFQQQLFIDSTESFDLVVCRPRSHAFEGALFFSEHRAMAFDLFTLTADRPNNDLPNTGAGSEILNHISTESGLNFEFLLHKMKPHIEELVRSFQSASYQPVEESHLATLRGTKEQDTILPLIRAWSSLHRLALLRNLALAQMPEEERKRNAKRPFVVSRNSLARYLQDFTELDPQRALDVLQMLMFIPDRDTSSSYDPHLKPLIALDQERVLIMANFALNSRFARNALKLLASLKMVNLDECGRSLERRFQEILESAGFKANKGRRIEILNGDGIVTTDLDVVAYREGILFLGQVKAVLPPGNAYEIYRMLQRLTAAAGQLNACLEHIDINKKRIGSAIDWPNSEALTIKHVVPCILTNDITLTGYRVGGFVVLDSTILEDYLAEAASSGSDDQSLLSQIDSLSQWHEQHADRVVYCELNFGSTVFLQPIVALDPVVG